ncbi:Dak1 domain-containing protein [Rhizobium sp. NFR07]|nr:Dak1 domain-containing protein [Rhizobium sp. NFR07]
MTSKTKKLINAPEDIIPEFIDGFVGAHADLLCVEGPTGRAVVARHGLRDGKVGIVVGGGSGHEPAFAGYVGGASPMLRLSATSLPRPPPSISLMPGAPRTAAAASCFSTATIPAMC